MLLLTFAAFYFAIGPGNYFSVDEVMEEETAQALIFRRALDIPVMNDSRHGRENSFYTVKSAGLPFAALPFIYVGLKLDDAYGSMNGGTIAGPPLGLTREHPLRFGGRLVLPASLVCNALVGGGIVALLFMIGTRLSENRRAALLMAIAAGIATLVMSEATHFYQHALSALMLITAFWFFGAQESEALDRRAFFGGLSLGVAMLARPNAVPAAVVLFVYGLIASWKLVRDSGDRRLRMIRRTVLAGAGPAAGVAATLYFNWLRFGSATQFGYWQARERFVVDASQIAHALAGYLFSPALSVFVFAPPLILVVAVGRRAYRRWPLQTATLVTAAIAHLLFISLQTSWSGDLSYGPRYMLEMIVLLMPLTLPAFEIAAELRPRLAAIAVAAVVMLGFAVQLVGVAVYVFVNEWYRSAVGIAESGKWVFVPSASPVVVGLRVLRTGRHLAPWAIRAWAHPGPALMLWFFLVVILLAGGTALIGYLRAPTPESRAISSDRLPIAIVLTAALPILAGFALVRPIAVPLNIRVYELIEAGLAAQHAGRAVAAAEDYAMVLELNPTNQYAWFDLGVLQQDAGRTPEAFELYKAALRTDRNFLPAQHRLNAILRARLAEATLSLPKGILSTKTNRVRRRGEQQQNGEGTQ